MAIHAPGEADLNLYAYVHGKVLVAVDPVGLETQILPLTQQRLTHLAYRYGLTYMALPLGRQNQIIGRWFQENALERVIGVPENTTRYPVSSRQRWGRAYVVPDGVADREEWNAPTDVQNDSPGITDDLRRCFHRAKGLIAPRIVRGSTFYEAKVAREGTVIDLNYSQGQIRGLIDAAARAPAARDPKSLRPPSLEFVTTFGVTVGPDVVAYATKKGVTVSHAQAWEVYDTDTGKSMLGIGPSMTLNPGVQAEHNKKTGNNVVSTPRVQVPQDLSSGTKHPDGTTPPRDQPFPASGPES